MHKINVSTEAVCIIFWELEEGQPENGAWVKELGRRKYICFLRFLDEMTASLNRYFALLEELFILDHEIKEEILRKEKKLGSNFIFITTCNFSHFSKNHLYFRSK